jgi:hypothetical protein
MNSLRGNRFPDLSRFIAFINPDIFRESVGIPMKRITINALVDIGCLITFIPSLITGLVLYLVLPEGGGRGTGGASSFLGIARSQWVTMHDYPSLVFAALLIIHLLLHVKFFRNIRSCLSTGDKKSCETE